jgi:flagellar assembly protein FliH
MTRRRREALRVFDEPENLAPPFPALPGATDPAADPVDAEVARRMDEGFRQGWQRALQKFEQEVASFRERMADSLKRFAEMEELLTRQHESLLLEITMEAASRIVRERLDAGDPVAARALREALSALPARVDVKARLHPEDLEAAARLLSSEVASGRLELAADSSVSRGGVVLESAVGTVDATLETAVAGVRDGARGAEEP